MRYYQLYQSDPWYNTSDVHLKILSKEVFRDERGCFDGHGKIWKQVWATWGDEGIGGSIEVENSKLDIAKVTIKAWDKEEGRFIEEEGEFWSWYQLYKWLSSIVWDFSPRFRYNPIHIYNTGIVADFWSFSSSFRKEGDMEEEMKKLYVLISSCQPGLGEISSIGEGKSFEIYTGAEKLALEQGMREIQVADNIKKEEVVRIYLPLTSTYEEFMREYGKELYRILSELDKEVTT